MATMKVRKAGPWWEAVCYHCGPVWDDMEHRRTFLMAVSHYDVWHSWHSGPEERGA